MMLQVTLTPCTMQPKIRDLFGTQETSYLPTPRLVLIIRPDIISATIISLSGGMEVIILAV